MSGPASDNLLVDTATLDGFSVGPMTLRPFAGDRLMTVRVEAPAGSAAASHSHPHEQMSLIVSGLVLFHVAGTEFEAGPGSLLHIPSNVQHDAEALEDSVFYDIFHPVRDDFLERAREEPR